MWAYHRPSFSSLYETGALLSAGSPPLRPHLHAATQILVLTGGRRRMRIARDEIEARAGDILVVPPGIVHAATSSGDTWSGLNFYITPDIAVADAPSLVAMPHLPDLAGSNASGCADFAAILDALARGTVLWTGSVDWASPDPSGCRETRIRRFAQATGLPPAAHARMVRLDRARRLIAEGVAPAEAAAATGFADQSHLGRLFRESYGTTPSRYAFGR